MWPLIASGAPWLWFAVRLVGAWVDPAAVLLPVWVAIAIVACSVIAIIGRRPRFVIAIASLAAFGGVAILLPRTARPTSMPLEPLVLVSANAFAENPTPLDAAKTLASRDPDVLVAVEAPREVRRALDDLLGGYTRARDGTLDIYSRWPLEPLPALGGVPSSRAFRVTVERPAMPFVLVAVHLPNPLHEISFSAHVAMIQSLLADVRGSPVPVVLAGDFNASDRTHAYQVMTSSMRDAMRSSWAGSTYVGGLYRFLSLRIDHILEPETWCSAGATTFAVPGSDHRGLSVRLGPCPSASSSGGS